MYICICILKTYNKRELSLTRGTYVFGLTLRFINLFSFSSSFFSYFRCPRAGVSKGERGGIRDISVHLQLVHYVHYILRYDAKHLSTSFAIVSLPSMFLLFHCYTDNAAYPYNA